MAIELPHSECGSGPAVLMLHAGVASRSMWDEHLKPLAAGGFRAIAVDLRGFGEAPGGGDVEDWEDVVATMDALGLADAVLLGSSFGAAVALRVAALHPDRASALALFSAPAVPEPEPSPELLAIWDAEDAAVEGGEIETAVAAAVSGWVGPQASAGVGELVAASVRANLVRDPDERPRRSHDPLENDPALLASIRCPVLLVAGEYDLPDFKAAPELLAARLPGATETAFLAGCGHLAPLEAPDEVIRLVLGFLGGN